MLGDDGDLGARGHVSEPEGAPGAEALAADAAFRQRFIRESRMASWRA